MTFEMLRNFLAWCTLINMGMALVYFLILTLGHDWVYRMHGKWFKMSVEQFDAIHYRSLLTFKIGIFLFNLVPYIALHIIG